MMIHLIELPPNWRKERGEETVLHFKSALSNNSLSRFSSLNLQRPKLDLDVEPMVLAKPHFQTSQGFLFFECEKGGLQPLTHS